MCLLQTLDPVQSRPTTFIREPSLTQTGNPRDWISFEVNTRVDEDGLSLGEVPATFEEDGEAVILTPTIVQDDGVRTMPVAWPMSYAWSGENVHLGTADSAPADAVAAFDSETNTLTPLRPGDASLTLAVNDKTVTAVFTVAADVIVVTPESPSFAGNVITIPAVDGVEYIIDGKVVTGDVEISEDTTVTVRALDGYVLDESAVASWDFTYDAPVPLPESGNLFYFANTWEQSTEDHRIEFGARNDEIFVGDWDGDGKDTLAIRRGNEFFISNELSGDLPVETFRYGRAGDDVLVGDWNGDGKDTFGVRRGTVFFLNDELRGGNADTTFNYGRNGDLVHVGDWDGDGTDTITVQRGTTFFANNKLVGGNAEAEFKYGRAGDEVFAGDFNGSGTDTLAVRRGNTFFVKNDIEGGNADITINYGRASDRIHIGDWDGDGIDTPVVNRYVRS